MVVAQVAAVVWVVALIANVGSGIAALGLKHAGRLARMSIAAAQTVGRGARSEACVEVPVAVHLWRTADGIQAPQGGPSGALGARPG